MEQLEFKQTFPKGSYLLPKYHLTILKCKNIDFGHIQWSNRGNIETGIYNNKDLIFHIIDNIIDINAHDNNNKYSYTLFCRIISHSEDPLIIHHTLNNGYINNSSFKELHRSGTKIKCDCGCHLHNGYGGLVNYLTEISFGNIKGFLNLEKYYYMVLPLLLVMKRQSKVPNVNNIPNNVIKRHIITFVYQ